MPESGIITEMIKKWHNLPEGSWRLAYWWEPSPADTFYQGMDSHYVGYAPTIIHFLMGSYNYPQNGPAQFGVKLKKPFREYDNEDCMYGSPAISEKFLRGSRFLLVIFDGEPFVAEGAIEKKYYKGKYSQQIDRMFKATDVPHFGKLYQGKLMQFEGNLDKATDIFLKEAAKWCNLDIDVLEGMYKASGLYSPALKVPDDSGNTPLHRKMRKLLLNRKVYHHNEVPGYISLRYKLRMNLVTGRPELFDPDENTFLPMEDTMLNSIYCDLKWNGSKMSMSDLRYLIGSDYLETYHPFKEYFTELSHYDPDEEPDFISELAAEVNAEDPDYWIWCLRKWMVGVVATALNRKATNHQVLVLSGPQGCGKSQFLLRLIPELLDGYMYSGQIDPSNKDSKAYLAEKLLINLEELDHISGKQEAELKSLITETQVDYRRPYDKYSKIYNRHASFCSSVNHESVLSDSTGSRRFLIVKVDDINYQHSVNMDRVWAQAYHLYKDGFQYWFDGADNKRINAANEDYQIRSVEEELLLERYKPASSSDPLNQEMTATEMLKILLDNTPRGNDGSAIRLGKALSKHGFTYKMISGRKKWIVRRQGC